MARRYVIEHKDTATGEWKSFWWSHDPDLQTARATFASYMPQLFPQLAPLMIAVGQARARQMLPNQELEFRDKKFRMKIRRS